MQGPPACSSIQWTQTLTDTGAMPRMVGKSNRKGVSRWAPESPQGPERVSVEESHQEGMSKPWEQSGPRATILGPPRIPVLSTGCLQRSQRSQRTLPSFGEPYILGKEALGVWLEREGWMTEKSCPSTDLALWGVGTLEPQNRGNSASGVLSAAPSTFGGSFQSALGSQEPPGAGVGGKGRQAAARTPGLQSLCH